MYTYRSNLDCDDPRLETVAEVSWGGGGDRVVMPQEHCASL